MVARMQINLFVIANAGALEALLGSSRTRDLQTKYATNRGPLHSAETRVAPANGICRDASLAVRGSSERYHDPLAGDRVPHFDGISYRPNVRIGRAHLLIDTDAAALAELESGRLGEVRLRSNADRQNHKVARVLRAGFCAHQNLSVARLEARHSVA